MENKFDGGNGEKRGSRAGGKKVAGSRAGDIELEKSFAKQSEEADSGEAKKSCLGMAGAWLAIAVSALFLLNPTAGIFELLPDNLPILGNLDEAFFTMLLLGALSYLGVKIPFIRR